MREPEVAVGILSDKTITFELTGIYSTPDVQVVSGKQNVTVSDSGISFIWNGKAYTTLEFTPTSYDGDSFELEGVTIGVDFHWERKENQRFRGALRLIVNDGRITAINVVKVEDYLVSVISSEMRATSSLPLLRAHAVISRSWLLKQMQNRATQDKKSSRRTNVSNTTEIIRWWDHEDHDLFDVCADDHCQRYQGITRASRAQVRSAILSTWGEVLMYGDELCDARFSKCCGGAFEEFQYCWEPRRHDYLVAARDAVDGAPLLDLTVEANAREWILGRPDAFCSDVDESILAQVLNNYDRETVDFYRWIVDYDVDELSEIVRERSGIDFGEIRDLVPLARGTSGRIYRLKIVGSKRTMIVGKELEIRKWLSRSHLYSSAFMVERTLHGFRLHGAGWGHGVGLCQIGAAVMGERGFNYRQILSHYFKDAEIRSIY